MDLNDIRVYPSARSRPPSVLNAMRVIQTAHGSQSEAMPVMFPDECNHGLGLFERADGFIECAFCGLLPPNLNPEIFEREGES